VKKIGQIFIDLCAYFAPLPTGRQVRASAVKKFWETYAVIGVVEDFYFG